MTRIFPNATDTIKHSAKEERGVLALYLVIRIIVVAILVRSVFAGRFDYALLCGLTIVLLLVPDFLERKLSIEIPGVLEGIIILFIFAAEILGEIGAFYVILPFWDTMLHTLWGFLAAGIGFAMVDILNRSESSRLNLTPLYMATAAFCFSMTVGAVWELFEFSMDYFFGFDMQKDTLVTQIGTVFLDPTNSNAVVHVKDIAQTAITTGAGQTVLIEGGYLDIGIVDTMQDLLVNLIGAATFSAIGFAYVKNRKADRRSIASHFIPKLRGKTPADKPSASRSDR